MMADNRRNRHLFTMREQDDLDALLRGHGGLEGLARVLGQLDPNALLSKSMPPMRTNHASA